MNGVTLDTAARATGPVLQGGNVLAGTSFVLAFQSASSQTLTALANGVVGVVQAGIPMLNEIGAFIPIFGVPAAVAWYLSGRQQSRLKV